MDSCYLCEIGKDGLIVPIGERKVLLCTECVYRWLLEHPRLALLTDRERAA